MRVLIVAVSLIMVFQAAVAAQWETWDGFEGLIWETQDWPLTEKSELTRDGTHVLSGKTALQTTIECVGWGGGIKVVNPGIMNPPKKGMSVSIYCESLGGKGMPLAKLEVYPVGGGDVMGSPDTPLQLGEWAKVFVPASVITRESEGCGIIFIKGESSGKYKLWIDKLTVDDEVWDDFEASGSAIAWEPMNISGPYSLNLVDTVNGGKGTQLSWEGDGDGVEMKAFPNPPLNLSEKQKIRVRLSVPKGSPSLNMNIWMFDGERGSFAAGPVIQNNGQWVDVEIDLGPHRQAVNLGRLKEFAIVCNGYSGGNGKVIFDNIDFY